MTRARSWSIFLISYGLLMNGCGPSLVGDCEDRIIQERASPDGGKVVTVFERNCGATTDFSTIVTLCSISDTASAESNRVFVAKGQKKLAIFWPDSSAVRLSCADCKTDDIFFRADSLDNVGITFE